MCCYLLKKILPLNIVKNWLWCMMLIKKIFFLQSTISVWMTSQNLFLIQTEGTAIASTYCLLIQCWQHFKQLGLTIIWLSTESVGTYAFAHTHLHYQQNVYALHQKMDIPTMKYFSHRGLRPGCTTMRYHLTRDTVHIYGTFYDDSPYRTMTFCS